MLDIIIVGAGPAGISLAVEARQNGIDSENIVIIEKAQEHSFSIRKYYPETKLVTANYKGFEAVCTGVMCIPDLTKHETISYLDQAITENNLHVNYDESVWKIEHFPEKSEFCVCTDRGEYHSQYVVIAIGILGKPNKPDYSLPQSLKDRLLFDITSTDITGARVLVVGGGDSASEYVQYLAQKGNDVAISYRKSTFSRMNEINLKSLMTLAEQQKAELMLPSDIIKIVDENGLPRVCFTSESERVFDYIVYALGGSTPHNFLKMIGIEFVGKDPKLIDGHETSVPGLFLAGDLSAGTKGGSIIWAFNSANTVMKKILSQLEGG